MPLSPSRDLYTNCHRNHHHAQRPNSPQTVPLTGPGGTSSLCLGVASGGTASSTVTAGATATYALSIGGAGMSGTASLTCTGAPTEATCSVPASVTLSATTASTFNPALSQSDRFKTLNYKNLRDLREFVL